MDTLLEHVIKVVTLTSHIQLFLKKKEKKTANPVASLSPCLLLSPQCVQDSHTTLLPLNLFAVKFSFFFSPSGPIFCRPAELRSVRHSGCLGGALANYVNPTNSINVGGSSIFSPLPQKQVLASCSSCTVSIFAREPHLVLEGEINTQCGSVLSLLTVKMYWLPL